MSRKYESEFKRLNCPASSRGRTDLQKVSPMSKASQRLQYNVGVMSSARDDKL